MKKGVNKPKKNNRFLKVLGFSILFGGVATAAIVTPIMINKNKKYSLTLNHSTNTYEGNKNRINYYINHILHPNYYTLSGSLKINGKSGVIGEDGVALTSSQRSMISVNEAVENNMFTFEIVDSYLEYQMVKNYQINYQLEYIKPYASDSSYASVGIKLYAGSGASYYETIYEYRDTSLYGFKKAKQHLMIDKYIDEIEKNPNNYFALNKEIGKIGDSGIYAKNIKTNSINTNTIETKKLKNENYYISISSANVDTKNPTLLKITYTITYDDGVEYYYASSKEAYLGPFDVEQGVDDPVSKLKNFISSNEDWINNLNQYFEFNKPESDETVNKQEKTEKEYTIREAYEKNLITLKINSTIRSKLDREGIELEFKAFNEEKEILQNNPNELSVLNYEFDSTTPMYRVYFTSYPNTPLAYTESVLIEGIAQEGEFKMSQEEMDMNAFSDYLSKNNLGFEDVFDFDNQDTNPIALSDYFMNDPNAFSNGKYNISFDLVETLYEKYIDVSNDISNQYESPFNKFVFKQIKNDLDTSYTYEDNTYNINDIASRILNTINNRDSFEKQLDTISTSSSEISMNMNISLGDSSKGTIYTNVEPFEIYVSKYFISKEKFITNLLSNVSNWITSNQNKVIIETNGKMTIGYIKQQLIKRDYSSIFSSANIYNIPNDLIKYPELLPQMSVEINMDHFNTFEYTKEEIESMTNITIELKLTINGISSFVLITKTLNELTQN